MQNETAEKVGLELSVGLAKLDPAPLGRLFPLRRIDPAPPPRLWPLRKIDLVKKAGHWAGRKIELGQGTGDWAGRKIELGQGTGDWAGRKIALARSEGGWAAVRCGDPTLARSIPSDYTFASMPKVYDTTFREMFSKGLPALLPWLLPDATSCKVLKEDKDLATTTRWPDLVLRVDRLPAGRTRKCSFSASLSVIHIFECQCQADPALPRSMLTRAILAHDLHRLPVRTTVLALAPAAVPPPRYVYGEGLDGEVLHHSVTVRRVFEESADTALQRDIADLLPLVTVMAPDDGDRCELLRRVFARIIDHVAADEKRKMLVEQAANFATLRWSRQQVHGIVAQVLQGRRVMIDPLRDFPLVRDGYRRGRREGRREGQAKSLLTLLAARGLKVSPAVRTKILACTETATLDRWLKNALRAASIAEVIDVS